MAVERSKNPFSSSSSSSDRISGLSNDLLHKILSNFDLKELVQTSILSRKWRYFWTSLSSLSLDSNKLSTTSLKFDDVVSRVLYHGYCQNSNLSTLKVTSNEYCRESNIRSWIQMAIYRNIQNLDIQLHKQRRSKPIDLPPSLFTCQSLTFLELALNMWYRKGNAIFLPVEYSVNLPHLKDLKLSGVHRLSTQFLDKIFSGCPVLEVLVITNFSFDESLCLVITSNVLKRLVILVGCDGNGGFKCEVTVDAPNLKSFTCIDWNSNIYHLKNVSSLETMFLNNEVSVFARAEDADRDVIWLQEICRVKSLTLARCILKVVSQSVDIFHKASISFRNLSYLNVTIEIDEDYVQAVKWILENSPNIETLVIKNFSGFNSAEISDIRGVTRSSHRLDSAEISHRWGDNLSFRNLKRVELHNVEGFDNELVLLTGFLKNAKILEEMIVFTSTNNIHKDVLEMFTLLLMSFPRVSTRVEILFRKLEH